MSPFELIIVISKFDGLIDLSFRLLPRAGKDPYLTNDSENCECSAAYH